MNTRYKIILSNNYVYKEIELAQDAQRVKVGTGVDCDVRLHKGLFFCPIELLFVKKEAQWSVMCSDELYLTVGDIRKLITKPLHHGDTLEVRYQDSDNLVLDIDFLIDFDDGKRKYERAIEISGKKTVSIGADRGNDIVIKSPYIQNDAIKLHKKGSGYTLDVQKTTYGVYLNGRKSVSGAEICDGDFLSVSDFFFYVKQGKIWTEVRSDMSINGLRYNDYREQNNYPKFNRNTRLKGVVSEEPIEFLDPPEQPKKPKNNLLLRLMPSLGMLIASGAMAMSSGRMVAMSMISGAIAIVTAVMTFLENNKEYKTQVAERVETYNAYVDRKRREIEGIREEEREQLEELYIGQSEQLKRFAEFSPGLFDRVREDEDYLCVRLGSGDLDAKRTINYKKQERLAAGDELQMIPAQVFEEYKHLHQAPIVCDFKAMNALGVIGEAEYRFALLKNIVLDIAARQYHSDVKMVFVAEKENKDKVYWLRFLPHVYNEEMGIRNIVCDDESKNLVYEYLYKELTIREQNKSYQENIVVFFYDDYGFKNHPISKFIDKAKNLGVTFVFFGDTTADVAQGCDNVVLLEDASHGTLVKAANANESVNFTYPTLSDAQAQDIVRLLAPVYTEEISLEGTLTKNISMFEMLNILAVDDIDLKSRWETSQVHKSMAAPLGVSKTGTVYLDLHDKAHGPHGLVAGTTGSGKSEILQTYILAMATLFHPYEVSFVIIDFKGGGMVNQFRDLPHLVGAITNIDGKEINRSLKSIKAELQKRQRLFAEADVNHIDKYIKKYKAGEVAIPLPHLIIIVDEFAELKAEQPEFMKELISAARIGRSLGVHLILATQKPSGQVNEQIWSNSRFKLCLKVQSKEDSNEVIKSPLAAEIKEPGRAYLQVGNNEIFELFQSAYSGASEKSDNSNMKEFTIYGYGDSGRKQPVYVQKKKSSGEGTATQLEAIVKYVADYCGNIALPKLPDICLPPLAQSIDFHAERKAAEGYPVEIGIYDDPDNQYQGVYSVDLAANNLMIIGSSQSGKTNLLQGIIRSLATKYTPEEVNIYIIDFASMVLKNFEKLNHVGGVVTASDDEKLKNLFKLLNTEIAVRKEKLLSVGVSSFGAYKESGATDLPLIVLMVDNQTALKELYFKDEDELLNLCREGLSVGISVIIANAQTTGIGYRYLSNFSSRIALFCNDPSEYSTLFSRCRANLESIPGRCIVEVDKAQYECQSYLSFRGEKEIDRVKEIKQYIEQNNRQNRNRFARKIPVIPATLTSTYVQDEFSNYMREPFTIVSGLDFATVMPAVLSFAGMGLLAISGKEKSGKHNWIRYAIRALEENNPGRLKLYMVDGINKKFAPMKQASNVCGYSVLPSDAVAYVKEIEAKLKERYDAMVAGDETILQRSELLMLVVDNSDAMQMICADSAALAAYKNIVGKYKNMNVCIVVFVDNAPISYSSPEILKNIRDQRHVLFFDDLQALKLFDPPLSVVRGFKKPVETGEGYYIKETEYVKLKTPMAPMI